MKYIIVMLLVSSLTGCDVFESILGDCIDFDGPEFNKSSIPSAVLNETYDVTITASINNEPNDSLYGYTISLIGSLPAGVTIYKDSNERTIQIIGTPTEIGLFNFKLKVEVTEPYNDYYSYDEEYGLCYTEHEENYVLVVNAI